MADSPGPVAGDDTTHTPGEPAAAVPEPVRTPARRWIFRGLIAAFALFALAEAHAWYCCGRSAENLLRLRDARADGPVVTLEDVRGSVSGLPLERRRVHGHTGKWTMVLFSYPSALAVYNIRAVLDEDGKVVTVDRDPEPEPVMAPLLQYVGGRMVVKPETPVDAGPGPSMGPPVVPPAGGTAPAEPTPAPAPNDGTSTPEGDVAKEL